MHKKYFYLAVFWTITMFYLCLREMGGLPQITIPGKDKTVHFLFYFGFVIFWFKALFNDVKHQNNLKNLNKITVIGFFLGILIEFLQYYCTKTRSADVYDVLANGLGAITAFYLINAKFIKQQ